MHTQEYNSVSDFLDAAGAQLNLREVENNLIIGICNNLIKEKQTLTNGAVFINILEGDNVLASSVKTTPKAVIYVDEKHSKAAKAIAAYYTEKNIDLQGVIGTLPATESFIPFYNRKVKEKHRLLVYALDMLIDIRHAEGYFEIADSADILVLQTLVDAFYKEVNLVNKKPVDQLIQHKRLFVWKLNNQIVSIAAILRETDHAAIIGLVYTPVVFRKRGFARSCVWKLSEILLKKGFRYCSLFTDKSNPTSNKIYQEIGYKVVSEFQDVFFE